MGSFLLASGTKGKRFALPNSEILIHQPLIGGQGISGQATDIKIHADQYGGIARLPVPDRQLERCEIRRQGVQWPK